MNNTSSLRVVGTFSKVLKKDGSLLFRPEFKDSDFLLDFDVLYHFDFRTKWHIASITKTGKGFMIRFSDVKTFREAEFFIGEKFALPKDEIFGRSQDLMIGETVYDKFGKEFGKIVAFTSTPTYSLAEIEKEDSSSVLIPFTEKFFRIEKGKTTVLAEP